MELRVMLKFPWVAFRRVRTPWWRRRRIESDRAGFRIISTVDPDELEQGCDWSEVVRVEAFKRDAGIIELICVTIFTANDTCELNHMMHGWSEFIRMFEEALPEHFPEAEWFPFGSDPMVGGYPIS